jgi:hypothetical protein
MTALPLPDQRPPVLGPPAAPPVAPARQPTLFSADPPLLGLPAEQEPALPHAARTAAALVRLVLESLDGRRSAGQLESWFSETVLAQLAVERGLRRRAGRTAPAQLRSVRVQHPHPGVAEVSVRLHAAGRSRAWAMRLAAGRQRWRCTELEMGPRPVPGVVEPLSPWSRGTA